MSETFGQYLTRRREAAGLTQAESAGRAGLTPTYIGFLERGSGPTGVGVGMRPRLEALGAIAEALGVPLAEVRGVAGYDPPADSAASCEFAGDTFGESDFAALHRMHERLGPEGRRSFRPVLEMVRRELESLLKAQVGEGEFIPAAHRRRGPGATRAPPAAHTGRG